MILNFFRKLFSKKYCPPCIELTNRLLCHVFMDPNSSTHEEGAQKFFNTNHFTVAYNMFEEEWDEKVILEEVFKKLILIYNFDPNNPNIIIVYKDHKKVYLPNRLYVDNPPRAVFVYDRSKVKVSY